MPTVLPISELQRNISSITKECHATERPIYLTKNGAASLVVMDAKAFDREMAIHSDVMEREERVYRAIMRGREDELEGRTRSLTKAIEDARSLRESSNDK